MSQHPVYRHSGIARPVEPKYPTNKAVLVLALVAGIGGVVYALLSDDATITAAALVGLEAALITLLSWAATRELSPEDNPAAFLAVALALACWPRVGEQSLLTLAAVLMASRLVNRSTGKAAEQADSALVTGLFAWTAWTISWALGVVGALALILDARVPTSGSQARHRRHFGYALALVGVVVARVIVGIAPLQLPAHLPVFGAIAGVTTLAALLYPQPSCVGDVDQAPLSRTRVRLGLGLGVLAAVLLSLDSGVRLQAVASLWACVLAVPLGLPIVALRRRRSPG